MIHFYIEKKELSEAHIHYDPILKYFYFFIYIYTQYNTFTNLEGHILNLKYDFFLGGRN